jgi:hypothetical protein
MRMKEREKEEERGEEENIDRMSLTEGKENEEGRKNNERKIV